MVNRTEPPEMTPVRANMLRLLSEYCVLGYELRCSKSRRFYTFCKWRASPSGSAS